VEASDLQIFGSFSLQMNTSVDINLTNFTKRNAKYAKYKFNLIARCTNALVPNLLWKILYKLTVSQPQYLFKNQYRMYCKS